MVVPIPVGAESSGRAHSLTPAMRGAENVHKRWERAVRHCGQDDFLHLDPTGGEESSLARPDYARDSRWQR